MDVDPIMQELGFGAGWSAAAFQSEEDGAPYPVWRVTDGTQTYVLKRAKGQELAVYTAFFAQGAPSVPRFLGSVHREDGDYFLMEFVPGETLCRCTREGLVKVLDALIALQDRWWGETERAEVGWSFARSLPGRRDRGAYLNDPLLERAYGGFLERYAALPRTLCHDDLLPFNVLVSGEGAKLIDWEQAGILPYPTSLARLIAHGSEDPDALFFIPEADKQFAVDYYYHWLVRNKGIPYEQFRADLDAFLLYEYCEWIMLGNKYPDADRARFDRYRAKAIAHVQESGMRTDRIPMG